MYSYIGGSSPDILSKREKTMKNNLVKYSRTDGCAVLTLDRPEALNAMNDDLILELIDCLEEIRQDKSVRLLVLTGQGEKSFCAGGDIAQMSRMDPEEAKAFSELGHRMTGLLASMPCVTVAAVNGYALGGGTEISLACDLRVASSNALFALPEVGLGIYPGFGGTQRLPRLVGTAYAKEIMFTAEKLTAEKAHRIGLVNEVVEQKDLLDYCRKLSEKISRNSANAVRLCKQSIDTGLEMTLDQGLAQEEVLFAELFHHPDQREGTGAFVEKRKPHFVN